MAIRFHTQSGPHGPHGKMILSTPVGWVQLTMKQGPSFDVLVSMPSDHDRHDELNNDGNDQWEALAEQGWCDVSIDGGETTYPCSMDLFNEDDDSLPHVVYVFKEAGLLCSFDDGDSVGPAPA